MTLTRDEGVAADGGSHPLTPGNILLQIAQVLTVLFLAPLILSIIVQFEEWVRRTQGTEISQPYRNLWELLRKQIVAP